MDQHIDYLLNNFLSQVAKRGVNMKGYNSSCSRIKKFFDESRESCFSEDLLLSYLELCKSQMESKTINSNYYRFQVRVVRMIRSFAITGTIDFSPPKHLKYHVSEEIGILINDIFDYFNAKDKRRCNLISPMRHFFWYIVKNGHDINDINDDIILSFLLDEVPVTNKGQKKHVYQCIVYISVFLRSVKSNDIRYDYSKLKHNDDPYRLIPPFEESEISTLLSSIDVSTPIGKRNYSIIALAYETGLRGGDVIALRRSDIDWNNLEIKIVQSKTADPVIVELNGEVANALADYILEGRPQTDIPYVFVAYGHPFRKMSNGALYDMFEKVCSDAGIKKIPGRSFHSLRRSFEVVLTKKGVPLELVSKMAGHNNVESDKPYLTYNRDETSHIVFDFKLVPIRNCVYSKFNKQ